jgi:3-oxoacyl-[acyl-carrier-protein] synthase-3
MTDPIGLLGLGYAVPAAIRANDDPIFQPLREAVGGDFEKERALFFGNRERRSLRPDESLADFMAQAAEEALKKAGIERQEIDRLYGYASVSDYIAPNSLYDVHRRAGLAERTLVVPVQSEFSNFLLGVLLAAEAIRAGHSRKAFVAVGAGWTRNMDYTQGHSIGIGDGAGAAIVGPSDRFVITDWAADTFSNEYGAMAMRIWPDKAMNYPTYGIHPDAGVQAFLSSGMNGPPRLVLRLLEKHSISPDEVTLITHQATRKLMDHWAEQIRPRAYLDTYEEFGNMVIASIPVTLAKRAPEIRTPWLVLAGLGIGAHQMALLLRV